LQEVLKLSDHHFSMGPQAQDECTACPTTLKDALDNGTIAMLDDSTIPSDTFTKLLEKYDLGAGETECLTFASHNSKAHVCTDDLSARKATGQELGRARLCGSLTLLQECVRQKLLTNEQARIGYEQMRLKGAYLPDLTPGFFDV
jgi:predicted nucleic acid-binding protein